MVFWDWRAFGLGAFYWEAFGRGLMSTTSKNVGSLIKLFKYKYNIVENIGNEKNAIKKSARNCDNDMKKMNVITIETVKRYGS